MPESCGISVSRYVVPAARNMETARSIDRSRSEFKVGHVANCNKYPARARAVRLNCMRNNVSDIYRYPFSSFESDLYPAPGSRSYIPQDSRAQQATSYYFIAGDSADTRLPISPLLLPFANGKPELEARFLRGEPIKRLARTPHRAPRNRDSVLSREEQYYRVSRCPSYRYAVVLFKSEPIGESIVRARAFIRSINISNTLAILSRPAHVRWLLRVTEQPTSRLGWTYLGTYGSAGSAINTSTASTRKVHSLSFRFTIYIPPDNYSPTFAEISM